MLKRFLLPFSALCIGLPVILFVLPRLLAARPIQDSIGEFTQWEPSPARIRREVGPGPAGVYTDERHKHFAQMFQYRFRNNGKAVGISFVSDRRIRAKFAASIPRWDMASVSLDLHREARDVFRRDYEVDIYETYISMVPVKLAELRTDAGGSVEVKFDPRFARERIGRGDRQLRFLREVVFSRPATPRNLPNPMLWFSTALTNRRQMMSQSRPLVLQPAASMAVTR
jgi:hypothetical protein